jgi:hypothetical protein
MSIACATAFGAYGPTTRRRETQSIDALLIDETIDLPSHLAAFVKARHWTLPVVGIQLDAASHAGLVRLLTASHTIVGISSGATLFCLERIGWDHGFRLTGRSERRAHGPRDDAWRQDVAAYLSGTHPPAASPLAVARTYRASRADGILHTWVMQKAVRPPPCRDFREV